MYTFPELPAQIVYWNLTSIMAHMIRFVKFVVCVRVRTFIAVTNIQYPLVSARLGRIGFSTSPKKKSPSWYVMSVRTSITIAVPFSSIISNRRWPTSQAPVTVSALTQVSSFRKWHMSKSSSCLTPQVFDIKVLKKQPQQHCKVKSAFL